MIKMQLALILSGLILAACTQTENNPFFGAYNTPFETPAFDKIKNEHFMPAFLRGIDEKRVEVEAITKSTEVPTFENTVVALDNSGDLLNRVNGVFINLTSAETNDELQQIAKDVAPLMSKLDDEIKMNAKLFERIKAVYDTKEQNNLNTEQIQLLNRYYQEFVRGGANLNEADKTALSKINQKLALLTIDFGDKILNENNSFELVIEDKNQLRGLPEASIAAAEEGHPGKWIFTLHKPSLIPFLEYAEARDLREKMFKGYINRGNNNNEQDTKKILVEMANLRLQKANLMGYKNHADYVLDINMAKKPEAVYELLNKLWTPALEKAKEEAAALQALIKEEGNDFKLQPWDWWYYTEKLRKAKYDFDAESLRPYFQLENVRQGAFTAANKLYGITFSERTDIPVYHEEVKVYEVKDADNSHIGILYVDYFPRPGKGGGAWMEAYRREHYLNGKRVSPIICNVMNFSRPTGDKPALLSYDEVLTLFHEFGHALHGLLSDCHYRGIAGTTVARDFVELPSQIMENWASEPELLKTYARHYQTGEVIPQELLDKLQATGHFNQGFQVVEYLAASFLDMDWHTITAPVTEDPIAFENRAMNKIGLIPEIVSRYRSPYFAHIFSGEYSSGYYSYIWAEVLDADAYQAFKENGIFNKTTGQSFRKNILAAGASDEAMTLYKKFRGKEPDISALLDRKGLN